MSNIQFAVKLNAPDIEPRIRHQSIFEAFDALQSGEFLELSNDHDPKPLLYQFMMERADTYTWEYLENGPDQWRVAIGKK